MRIVPQILRHWLVLNTIRSVDIDSLMYSCETFPTLLHCKRMLLHDIPRGRKLIDSTIEEVANGKFHFLYRSRKEQGKDYDPTILWEEYVANVEYTSWQLMRALRELRTWLDKQKEYKYPAEMAE